jgi:hypothetical protein
VYSFFFFPFFIDALFLEDFFCSNVCFFFYYYNFFLYDLLVYEFCFVIWHFFICQSFGFFNLVNSLFEVVLYTRRTSLGIVEFYSLQKSIKIFLDEMGLIFFRLYNPINYAYVNLFIYLIYPLYGSMYVNKIQCFCFESLVINSFEILDLPVLFFISSDMYLEYFSSLVKLAFLYIHFIR